MLFILDSKQETLGVATNSNPLSLPYFDDEHEETLDGIHSYSFVVPTDHPDAKHIQVEGHIIIRNLDGEHLLFTIKETSDSRFNGEYTKKVYCEETAISELLNGVMRPKKYNSATLDHVVGEVVANTANWIVGDLEFGDSRDIEFEDYMTVLEALRHVMVEYNMELYFTVDLDGTKIKSKKINIVKRRGNETNVRFDYSYDLRGVSRTENSERVVTALVAVGKGDEESKRITLHTLPAFDEGDIFKLAGTDWIGSESALQQFGINGKHRFGIYVDEKSDTQQELKRRAIRELEKRKVPDLYYSCSVATLERLTGYESKRLRVGDTVVIHDDSFSPPMVFSGRVKGLIRSYTVNDQDKVDLGSYKPIALTTDKDILELQKRISLYEGKWADNGLNEEQVTEKVTEQVKTEIDLYKYDGRNLLTGTINYVHSSIATKFFTPTDDITYAIKGKPIVFQFKAQTINYEKTTNTYVGIEMQVIYEDNTTRYHSLRVDDNVQRDQSWTQYSQDSQVLDKEITSVKVYVVTRGYTGVVELKDFKLEVGSVATKYTVATEDYILGIDNATDLAVNAEKAVEDLKEQTLYKVEIISSNGFTFIHGQISTTLTAKVYKGKDDITSSIVPERLQWTKTNELGQLDADWSNANRGKKIVEITRDDIHRRATITCELLD